MNIICLIVTSFLENTKDITRLFDSLGESRQIVVVFVNQAMIKTEENELLIEKYQQKFNLIEIKTMLHISLSLARNKALQYLYNNSIINDNTLVLFADDDAWFPQDTIDFLLNCEIKAYSLKVFDPVTKKKFLQYQNKKEGFVKTKNIITDIISFSIIIPFCYLKNNRLYFNEKLGLGNYISQGEETFFCYCLYILGYKFFRVNHNIFHPYKKTFNEHNFYSLAYFLSAFTRYISPVFKSFLLFFMLKYSITFFMGFIKDRRYFKITKKIYTGFSDGKKDIYSIFK